MKPVDHFTLDFGQLTRYFADEHGQEWLGIYVPKQFTAKKTGSLGMPCQTLCGMNLVGYGVSGLARCLT